MNFGEYQEAAMKTAQPNMAVEYPFVKMMMEAGEAAQPIFKAKHHHSTVDYAEVVDELGDVLWNLAAACDVIGTTLEEVAQLNIRKLRARHGEQYNPAHYQAAVTNK